MGKIKLGILGATGRMGKEVFSLVEKEFSDRFDLAVVSASRKTDPALLLDRDLVIDFSLPDATEEFVMLALQRSDRLPVLVSGTTGLSVEQTRSLEALSKKTAVLSSSNFSIGIQELLQLLESSAPLLKKLGFNSVQMTEVHHTEKKDTPSGTALYLERELKRFSPGLPVQIKSVREGTVVGFHHIEFLGNGENLTLGHRALDRAIFARGAIEVGLWLAKNRKKPGLYSMRDFLKDRSRS